MKLSHARTVNGWIQTGIAVYLIALGFLGLMALLDTWSDKLALLDPFVPKAKIEEQKIFIKTFLYTLEGSFIGAVIVSLKGLHEYGAVRGVFKRSYRGSYILGPWAAVLLGSVLYALVRGGLLVFAGTANIQNADEGVQFGYFGFGGLIGFAWSKVLAKLNVIAEQIFSSAFVKQETEKPRSKISSPNAEP